MSISQFHTKAASERQAFTGAISNQVGQSEAEWLASVPGPNPGIKWKIEHGATVEVTGDHEME